MKTLLVGALLCFAPSLVAAAEFGIVATNNMRTILTRVSADFARVSGRQPKIVFDTGGGLMRRRGHPRENGATDARGGFYRGPQVFGSRGRDPGGRDEAILRSSSIPGRVVFENPAAR